MIADPSLQGEDNVAGGEAEEEGEEVEELKTPSVEEGEEGLLSPSLDSLEDLPIEALLATTVNQFSTCLRPILMGRYPVATSSEINGIITNKWKNLKEARRKQAGNLCKLLGGLHVHVHKH